MKKVMSLLLLLTLYLYADSEYLGKYLCNESQIIEITKKNLYISNATFQYSQSMKDRSQTLVDIFIKGDEAALMSPQPERADNYSLNIRNLKVQDNPPYVANCKKI